MPITLYETTASTACRAVLITADALELELNKIPVDLFKKEQYNPEFLKINPQHTIPTLIDNDGTVIWDSHAIVAYLVGKYAKDDSSYPKDLAKRALVDQRLHFNGAIVSNLLKRIIPPILFGNRKGIPQELLDEVIQVYEFLEKFLENRHWIAGDTITVADFCLIPNVNTIAVLVPIDEEKFPKVTEWIKKAQQLAIFSVDVTGQKAFTEMITPLLS